MSNDSKYDLKYLPILLYIYSFKNYDLFLGCMISTMGEVMSHIFLIFTNEIALIQLIKTMYVKTGAFGRVKLNPERRDLLILNIS